MKKLSGLFILIFIAGLTTAFGQFEGKIVYNAYDVKTDGSHSDESTFTLYVTPQRIMLEGENTYKMAGSFNTEGVLIRMEEKDFIFFTGKQQAMKITKAGLTSFMNMFGAKQKQQASENSVTYKKTDETKEIGGYTAQKFVFTNAKDADESSIIWMTQDLDINWGMLAEPWGNSASNLIGDSDFPTDLILKEGYFPLRIESYENETLEAVAEAQVTATDVESSKVQIPDGLKVVNLQNFLFEQLRQQQ